MIEIICCKQVTKSEIEIAILEGVKNCSSEINAVLSVPKFKMASACGCGYC